MPSRLQRILASLDLEERILYGASLFTVVSIFLPWLSGEWLGEDYVSYSGFQFFTSFIGIVIFLIHAYTLAGVFAPGVLRKKNKDLVRFCLTTLAMILTLASLSVLTKVTYDYTRMEIRFGIYFTLAGSLVSAFYAFWKLQESKKREHMETFHHPEDIKVEPEIVHTTPLDTPPPPPPPPPLEPEEHHIRP